MGAGRVPGPAGYTRPDSSSTGYDWNEGVVERRREGLARGTPVAAPTHPTWTTIGVILSSFFATTDMGERLWIIPERDSYTGIVRRWRPVIDHIERVKREAVSRSLEWQLDHRTDAAFQPGFGYVQPSNSGWDELEASPPGTEPAVCRDNFIVYLLTGYATEELHTSAIGSFRIAATADEVNLERGHMVLNIWMYNEMSSRSFGRFAHEWPFEGLPMRSQFMWWNWKERFNFDSDGNLEPIYRGNLAF